MGTYAITLNNFLQGLSDLGLYKLTRINVYDTVKKYKSKEIVINKYNNIYPLGASADIFWDDSENEYLYFYTAGGGSAYLLKQNNDNEWVLHKKIPNGAPFVSSGNPYYFIKTQSGKSYGLTFGVAEYDKDFNFTNNGYPYAQRCFAYDTKRNFLIVASYNPLDLPISYTTLCITQLDLNKEPSNVAGNPNSLFPIFLNSYTTTNEAINFLSYSSYDDMYYYSVGNSIYKTNPITGAVQTVKTKGTSILGLMIAEGSSVAYWAYIDTSVNNDIRVKRFNIDDPSDSLSYTELNKGIVEAFNFIYIDKVLAILTKNSNVNTISVHSLDFFKLSYKKNIYFPVDVTIGLFNRTWQATYQASLSTVDGISIRQQNATQRFKPLSGDKVDIHIPIDMTSGVGGKPLGSSSAKLTIEPITPYPVITTPAVVDCCLDELKCDINTKLAKKSCESTKRAIIGKHYSEMTKDAELLEALLWITTFDCLTCDDIEKLRCITLKTENNE